MQHVDHAEHLHEAMLYDRLEAHVVCVPVKQHVESVDSDVVHVQCDKSSCGVRTLSESESG